MKRIAVYIKSALSRLWRITSNNLGWKIVSVAAALLLWSYIISADSTITQNKMLANVDVTTSGLTVLQSRDLALLTDPTEFDDIHVRVETSQSNYSRVTNDNVHVELDLSQVTKAGVQQIELVGVTTYGRVVQITPSAVEVAIESLDSRYVPVNVEFTGDVSDSYWYNISRINPTQVTVSGPSSIVQTIVSARAQIDVTDMTSSYVRSAQLTLLDDQGREVSNSLARPSITVGMINIDIYPKIQLNVDDGVDTAITGTLPEGYQITHIDVQPETITLVADPTLLSELEALSFEPVNVTGRTSSFSTMAVVNRLKDIRYISSEQVNITVYIEEIETSVTLPGVAVTARGVQAGRTVAFSSESVSVRATGAYNTVNSLTADAVQAYVDVSGLASGEYTLPVTLLCDSHSELYLECDPASVTVTISGG